MLLQQHLLPQAQEMTMIIDEVEVDGAQVEVDDLVDEERQMTRLF